MHDTLIDNQAVNADIYARTAGAVDHFHARPHYAGCIVYGNVTNHHEPHQILEPRSPDIDHCNVEGYGLGAGGMDRDPLFLARWNTRGLPSGASPGIDAGDFVAAQACFPAGPGRQSAPCRPSRWTWVATSTWRRRACRLRCSARPCVGAAQPGQPGHVAALATGWGWSGAGDGA
ncbi:MAG: hypothetical protein IPO18_09110 [bacterium]|nr:hypothetical protein [bacterium]